MFKAFIVYQKCPKIEAVKAFRRIESILSQNRLPFEFCLNKVNIIIY